MSVRFIAVLCLFFAVTAQALLTEKLARAKKNDTESQVVEHKTAQ